MKIYVGNLPYELTEDELRAEFAVFGSVESVTIITDRDSGRPRGFAFVEMPTLSEGQAAVSGLNGKVLKDRPMTVNPARAKTDSRGGGSYDNRRGGKGHSRGGRDFDRRY